VDYTNVREVLRDVEAKKIPCGLSDEATGEFAARGSEPIILYSSGKQPIPTGISFTLFADGQSREVTVLGSIGIHKEYACLLAYSAARAMGIPVADCIDRVEYYKSSPGKMNIVSGMNSSIIIDDSYNANPQSFQAALEILKEFKVREKKGVVCGDMLELGPYGEKYHRELGAKMAEMLFDFVIVAGPLSKFTVEEALKQGFPPKKILHVKDSEEAGKLCREMAAPGDWVLVKGSRSTRMEKVFECFITSSTR
jgi:UDP-N-acetylmuramoyl-tripeptide--D-alanyl-D-alanine ligase